MKKLGLLNEGTKEAILLQQIASAESRLRDKLLMLNTKTCGISEYSQRYLKNDIASLNSTLGIYRHLLRLSFCNTSKSAQRSVFVDYGGGCGLLSFLAKEMGVGTVIYNDIYDVSCNDFSLLSNALKIPVEHIVCGDIGDLVSYVRENLITVDAITSYDVLEHIYDVESHFKQLAALSNGHFRVVYASGANIENPRYVHAVKKKQIEVENQNREKKWGHKERDSLRSYLDVRKDIISAYAPDLNSEEVDQLSRSTRGLIESDIKKYTDEYLQRGTIGYRPDHPTNTCDPYTGNWCEHLMHTRWLEQVLEKAGFSAKILAGYYFASGRFVSKGAKLILNAMICLLGRRSLFVAPHYVVYADHIAEHSTEAEGAACSQEILKAEN